MANESMLSEGRALAEYWALQTDPVLQGQGVPRGDGRLVLILPGLFGTDFYLRPLHGWLKRIGYNPELSMLSINAGCPKRLLDQLYNSFAQRIERQTQKIAIVGHSRGGMLAKALISRLGDQVSHLVTLGSPVGAMLQLRKEDLGQLAMNTAGISSASSVVDAGRAAMRLLDPDCDSPNCGCAYYDYLLKPMPGAIRVTSIFSTEDPIVPKAACLIQGANNIEVTGSHGGLVFNRLVYPHIAGGLA